MARPRKTPPVPTIEDQTRRVLALLSRWLTIYEAMLSRAEERLPDLVEAAAAKPPECNTLRELVNAATLCLRLTALANQTATTEGATDAAALRRHLDAVERAISAIAEEPEQ